MVKLGSRQISALACSRVRSAPVGGRLVGAGIGVLVGVGAGIGVLVGVGKGDVPVVGVGVGATCRWGMAKSRFP
ncbi:MAG: hypothetical protein DYG89_23325 [Caldilinea sp. CFX5]|nr:hypothetical protein [Caldilinea sp. CFX5]